MGKLARATQLLFGSSAGANQMAKFGSLSAGTPATYDGTTITPALIQTLSNYLTGWFGAVVGSNSPSIEDMNALGYLFAYQLAYILQQGIAEYDTGTTYYQGSICTDTGGSGIVYVSLTNSNTGNALTDPTKWRVLNGNVRTVSADTTLAVTDDVVRSDSTSANRTHTLPPIATTPIGKKITIKDVGTGGNTTSFKGSGTDNIDGVNTYGTALSQNDAATVVNNGTSWDVI